jgi:hypothetical protein
MKRIKILTGRKTGNREGGVQFNGKRWIVRIMIDNRRLNLGSFRSRLEAEEVYRNAYANKNQETLGFLRDAPLPRKG